MKKALALVEVDIDVIDDITENKAKELVKEYINCADFTYQNETLYTDIKNPEVLCVILKNETGEQK